MTFPSLWGLNGQGGIRTCLSAHGHPLFFLFVKALETGLCLVYPFGSRPGEK